ncbi:hypothetical protein [uncultured Nitratireductor sp.]|uniref:hypothetical protein n=1 Tax=uncultured Nitratireductor sp. TaxID=520953 RepID=UPI002604C239|nr:hypothetical protein [uncultured Nitratireductor sp.]
MPIWLGNAVMFAVGFLISVASLAFTLFMFALFTAPFWSIGLIALWVVGLI